MESADQKTYSPQMILALAAAIGKDDSAFEWLMQNDYRELSALVDVLVYGKEDALKWLQENGFRNVALFVDALEENDDAIEQLVNNHGKMWAATAQFVNGNDSAEQFLAIYFPHFGRLGQMLIDRFNGNISNSAIGGYSGPPRGLGGTRF